MESGLVFNIQRYSVQDGPGIRTTVFLKGCPLRCLWCHNPEGISSQPEVYFAQNLCIACGECRPACSRFKQVRSWGGKTRPARVRPLPLKVEACELCGACAESCPTQARRIAGRKMTVAEVLDTVLRDSVFFEESQGGVTFSGGEPLMQFSFLKALLEACRKCGIRTAVDTCGQARTEDLLEIAPLTDLFLFDLKLMNDRDHRRYTGSSNQLILENLRKLGQIHSFIWLRMPLIAGINDSPDALEPAARFAATIPGVRLVNLLPFHRFGAQKLQGLGRDEPAKRNGRRRVAKRETSATELQTPSTETIERALAIFHHAGLAARKGG